MDYCPSWNGPLPNQHCHRATSTFGHEDFRDRASGSYYSQPPAPESSEYFEIPRRHSIPQTCYNCGSPGHWAQNCPEPRRAIPAGAESNPRPSKRLKTNSVSYSRYSAQQPFKRPGLSRRHSQPPVLQPNSLPFNTYPATPMSAQSPGFSPWQHSPQYTSPVHQYPPYFGPHGLPTPNTTNGSQFPSPASSHASPQSQGYFPPQLSPFINTENPPQSYFEVGHTPCREERFKPPQCQRPHRDDVPYIAPPVEPWMQELQAIDGHRPQKLSGDQIVWRSACSVARPLPSTFFANDEVIPLPPISTLQPGMSVSKYISKGNHKEQQSNIRQTPEWPCRMNDPIFHEITSDCARISMEELVRRREQVRKQHTFKPSSILEDDQVMFADTQVIDRQVQQSIDKQLEADKVTLKHRNSISGSPAFNQQFRINQDAVARQHQKTKSWSKHNPREVYISHQPPRAEYKNMPHPKQCYGNKQNIPAHKPKPSYALSPPNSAGRKRARSIESPEDEHTASRRQEIDTPTIKKRRESQDTSAYSRRW